MKINSKKLKKIDNIYHAFFSRKGGVSQGIYKSLNCGLGSKDFKNNVSKNLEIVKKQFYCQNINLLNQVHSNKIVYLKRKSKKIKLGKADGIFTSLNNNIIGILTADCAPILLSSRCGKYICALHGGWKGLYKNIIKEAINLFKKNKVQSKDIICAVGPCISQKSYEVKIDFMKKIIKQKTIYKKLFVIKKNKIYFNLKKYAYCKLREAKINVNNIEINNKDTYSNPDLFFSYRRSVHKNEDDYGRNISIIVKKES